MEWCLRSADALGLCNWTVFFWGNKNLVDLGTLKKKIDEIWPCLLYFKNIWKFYVFRGRKRPVGTWWVKGSWPPLVIRASGPFEPRDCAFCVQPNQADQV
jgi:hypothetical protein